MINPNVRDELLVQLNHLPEEFQQRVLDFAQGLVQSAAKGVTGKDLLCFSGVLDPADAEDIVKVIEAGCEKVDPHEW